MANEIFGRKTINLKYKFTENDKSYISLVFHLPEKKDISAYEKLALYAHSSQKKLNPVTLYIKTSNGKESGFRAYSFIPNFKGWKKLEFKNMFSYGESNTIDFRKVKGIVGIIGPNHYGKSSILDIILF